MAHSLSNLFFEKNLLQALDKVFPIFSFTHFSIPLTGVASKAWQDFFKRWFIAHKNPYSQ